MDAPPLWSLGYVDRLSQLSSSHQGVTLSKSWRPEPRLFHWICLQARSSTSRRFRWGIRAICHQMKKKVAKYPLFLWNENATTKMKIPSLCLQGPPRSSYKIKHSFAPLSRHKTRAIEGQNDYEINSCYRQRKSKQEFKTTDKPTCAHIMKPKKTLRVKKSTIEMQNL